MTEELMVGALTPGEIIAVGVEDAARIRAAALDLVVGSGGGSADLAERAASLVTALPAELVRSLHRYDNRGSRNNTLLLRGLLPDPAALPPSPGTATPPPLGPEVDAAALTLRAVMSLLGEPFTFPSLYEGRLVQHVTPVPGQEHAQTSEGSATLDWHVEDGFSPDRCDYFGLLCLRGQPAARTLVASARALELEPVVDCILRQPRFVIEPDLAHDAAPDPHRPTMPVLTGMPTDLAICYDAVYLRPADPTDKAAAAALGVLAGAIHAAAVAHVLEPGELLIADNRRVVHARTLFEPRYDGADRWLLRTMVCAHWRAHWRRHGMH